MGSTMGFTFNIFVQLDGIVIQQLFVKVRHKQFRYNWPHAMLKLQLMTSNAILYHSLEQ